MSRHVNEVRLVGRLGNAVDTRELPSGTVLTSFSLIVDRPPRDVHGRTKVDTIACQTTRAAIVTRLSRVEAGDTIEVLGSLRRRFWKGGVGLASATEVDFSRLIVVKEVA